MSSRPTRATTAGRRYLDLQNKARADRRPTDELLQLYALEGFLDRLSGSRFRETFVLKGGVLLAAFDTRRPTRDIDLQAEELDNDAEHLRQVVVEIAEIALDDGLEFETATATAEVIRGEDAYSGVRVSMRAGLATARMSFHVDVNVGDPIEPRPEDVHLPRLLTGEIVLRGFPLPMVHAEKLVTAVSRGTANTRWRDFTDVYRLIRRHPVSGDDLQAALVRVAEFRGVVLAPLTQVLDGYSDIAQAKWATWRQRQRVEEETPEAFSDVLDAVVAFADPAILGRVGAQTWDPKRGNWR